MEPEISGMLSASLIYSITSARSAPPAAVLYTYPSLYAAHSSVQPGSAWFMSLLLSVCMIVKPGCIRCVPRICTTVYYAVKGAFYGKKFSALEPARRVGSQLSTAFEVKR